MNSQSQLAPAAAPTPPFVVAAPIDDARWFADEVQPHEPLLRNFLKGNFPAVRDVDDVVQESYLRMWKIRTSQPIHSAKAFLFKIARHLAIDLVRRDRASPIDPSRSLEGLSVIEERLTAVEALNLEEKTALLADALTSLPDRCREIVVLHKLEGLGQREVARRLRLSERTVEVQVARGVRRCEAYLRARGIDSLCGT